MLCPLAVKTKEQSFFVFIFIFFVQSSAIIKYIRLAKSGNSLT